MCLQKDVYVYSSKYNYCPMCVTGVVLGVAQLCNKKTGTYFTTFDEDIASAFAVYCCISISHVSVCCKGLLDGL